MRFILYISALIFILASCTKARPCECIDRGVLQDTSVFYINGNKKDSKKACSNLADSTETCTLKDK